MYWPDHGTRRLWVFIPKVASTSMRMALSSGEKCSHEEALTYNDRGYYTITFVRHPWDRIISALYSVLRDLGPFDERVDKHILNPGRARLDVHVRPQADLLRGLRLDFVGRYHRLKEDWGLLQELFGVPDLPHHHEGRFRPEVVDYDWSKIRHIYAEDLGLCPEWR